MTNPHSTEQAIAGQWRAGRGEAQLMLTDPGTGDTLSHYRAASAEDIDQALEACEAAAPAWARTTATERAGMLRRAASLLRDRSAAIARQLTLEQGKPLTEAGREVEQAALMLEWYAEEARRSYGQTIPASVPGLRLATLAQPIGPVAAFTPWNFPLMLSAIKVGAALAAGCPVILKPAEETPSAPAALVRCLHEAGVPGGALQLLLGVPAQISRALVESPVIRKLSFTGSTAVGRQLGALAGAQLKPVTLELGGHAAAIVCEDADLKAAVAALAGIKFRNAGQICANPSRFLVHRSHVATFTDAFIGAAAALRIGHGLEPGTTLGPLASARRQQAVQALVEDARHRGARITTVGEVPGKGFFVPPTVLTELDEACRVLQEEPFGPLVPIVPFDTLDEAIALANRLPVGLAAFGFTRNLHTARHIAEEVNAGSVGLNATSLMLPEAPFGGVLDSGIGRENGSQGISAYLSLRTIATA
ncbi:MAG: NAD-dependent succinate-semialdehyde dehydrogenase [Ramlibacter sp.]